MLFLMADPPTFPAPTARTAIEFLYLPNKIIIGLAMLFNNNAEFFYFITKTALNQCFAVMPTPFSLFSLRFPHMPVKWERQRGIYRILIVTFLLTCKNILTNVYVMDNI